VAKYTVRQAWSTSDRQRFSDGDVLRASARPGRRDLGPSKDEWDYDDNETDNSKDTIK